MAEIKKLEIPPPKIQSYRKQIMWTVIVLVLLGIVVIIFANVILGVILSLLGAVVGLGAQVVANDPL